VVPNPSVEATRNGMGRSGQQWPFWHPRPMPLRAPHLERYAVFGPGLRVDFGQRFNQIADAIRPVTPLQKRGDGERSHYTPETEWLATGTSEG
jgi:hypothetical protein